MKQPKIASIPAATPETSFTERAKVAKKIEKSGGGAVKRSYSMQSKDVNYNEKLALKLGQKRGKSMSSSEALRTIINDHRGQ